MKHVLIYYFSQSGQVRRAIESLTLPLITSPDIDVEFVELRPQVPYPFPWRHITAFFGVMPDTVLGQPGPNLPLEHQPGPEAPTADLVVLAYPVWFLMPAPPVQRFLAEDAGRTMRNSQVVALCVCRGMWYHAALTVKRALRQLPCANWLQIVVTHQGPQWATFLSVPRQMLFGSERRLLPGLPPAGIGASDLMRLIRIGEALRGALSNDHQFALPCTSESLPANRRHAAILPELFAWPYFYASATTIRCLERFCRPLQKPAIVLFAVILVLLILIGLPFIALASRLGNSLFPNWFERIARETTSAKPCHSQIVG